MIVLKQVIQQGTQKQDFRHVCHFPLIRESRPAFFVTNFARKEESIYSSLSYDTKKTLFQMKTYQIVSFGINIDTQFLLWITCIVHITVDVWNPKTYLSRSKFITEYARFQMVGTLVLQNTYAKKMSKLCLISIKEIFQWK